MHVKVPALVLVCASLTACTAGPPSEVAKPAPIAKTASEPAKPEPEPAKPTSEPAKPRKPAIDVAAIHPLARPGYCIGKYAEEDPAMCRLDPGVIGFHADGRVMIVMAPELGSCGEDRLQAGSFGRVAAQDAFDSAPPTAFTPRKGDDDGSRKAWTWVREQAEAGFAPATALIESTQSEVLGIRGVEWAADLKAPLAGWRLTARGDALTLIDPTNKAELPLGTVPTQGRTPSIVQVVRNPEGTHLFVLLALSDGSHCGSDPLVLGRHALPPAALAAPK